MSALPKLAMFSIRTPNNSIEFMIGMLRMTMVYHVIRPQISRCYFDQLLFSLLEKQGTSMFGLP